VQKPEGWGRLDHEYDSVKGDENLGAKEVNLGEGREGDDKRENLLEKRRIVWGEEKDLMMALDWCESLADGEPIPRECTFE
jgi:hypothetical protein